MPDANLEKAATAVVATGYTNAGQVCTSLQRVIPLRAIYSDFLAVLKPKVAAVTTGNPLDESTGVGPMIREADARRVEEWVREAVAGGARVVIGDTRRGAIHPPTVLVDVTPARSRATSCSAPRSR